LEFHKTALPGGALAWGEQKKETKMAVVFSKKCPMPMSIQFLLL
jgi:hypothetical protein